MQLYYGNKKVTPTAGKLLGIICQMFNLNSDFVSTESSWQSIGINQKDKERLLNRLEEKFMFTIFPADRDGIKKIWDALHYIEMHDDYRGKPAAYN
ncbi:MAG: hypothetical protein AABY22_30330, partial [Nanoarchaeota archaeon]